MAGPLLAALGLVLLGCGAGGQGSAPGPRQVSGSVSVNLGQDRDLWRPLIHTRINLSEVSSIKSSFLLRTFDPEGVVFYGDTKDGEDWFILGLKDGVPLMQISRDGMLVSVAGGPRLNDGTWHMMEVSNHGKFVVLDVDGRSGLTVGMQSAQLEDAISGGLRMALGGIHIHRDKMLVQFQPHMDACVREGSWLNVSAPWQVDADELLPCAENIQPGSYFPGSGFAIFNMSAFPFDDENGVRVELEGDFSRMDGTIFSVKAPGQDLTVALVANNNTMEVILTVGEETISVENTIHKLELTFRQHSVHVFHEEPPMVKVTQLRHPAVLTTWRDGRLAIGSLLGEGVHSVGSHFLTGCLKKIQVQGKNLDLGSAVQFKSVWSHSCPAM